MADRFDEGKRTLEEVPAPDLWAEASRRATADDVVPLPAGDERRRHPGRWLAAATVAAVLAGTVGVLLRDGDDSVQTAPRDTTSTVDTPSPGQPVFEGEWVLQSTSLDTGAQDRLGRMFTFAGGHGTWTDGCNSFDGTYTVESATTFHMGEVRSTLVACPMNPRSQAITAVMGAEQIQASTSDDQLVLSANDTTLTLRAINTDATTTTTSGGPATGSLQGFAVWPETALADVPDQDAGRSTSAGTAILFSHEILGWEDASVDNLQIEPSEDGREGGRVHQVSSQSTGGSVLIWTAPARAGGPYVVYQVDTPDRLAAEPTASVQVLHGVARGGAGPDPTGTVRTRVRFAYGDVVTEGSPQDSLAVPSGSTTGAILVIWEGAAGVLGAWGTPLPQGDFAAG